MRARTAVGVLALVIVGGLALPALLLRAGLNPVYHGIDRADFAEPSPPAPGAESLALLPDAPRPNIVVILADDLGWGDLGIQGSQAIRTPHMDRMAREGTRLRHFYSSAPICSPSRVGLLTGRYPLRSGIITAMQAAGDSLMRTVSYNAGVLMAKLASVDMAGGGNAVDGLPASEITVAEALRHGGYATMAIGKWHLGDFTGDPAHHPHNHGFDRFVGFNMSNDDWPVAFWRDGEQEIDDIGLEQQRYTGLFTDEAVGFIEEPRDAPFFLYLAHKDPHQPFFPSADFAGKSAGGPYGDAVEEFDASVGAVMAAVERAGIAERTLVIVTSDNGPWFEGSPGGLRGRKGQSYEGGFRVPFLAWWPGTIQAGQVRDTPAMNIDLFPTALALGGVALPTDREIDGADLWPTLAGVEAPDRPLYFFHDYDVEGVRVANWKYLEENSHYVWPVPLDKPDTAGGRAIGARDYRPPDSDESVPTLGTWPMLYELSRDPDESYNVAATHPDKAREMAARLDAWRKTFRANPRGWKTETPS